ELLTRGHPILTTNFDTLIEQACAEGGISYLIIPRFRGHPKRRENAPGVIHGQEEEKIVRQGVQGGSSAVVQGRRSQRGTGRERSRSDRDGAARVGEASRSRCWQRAA